MLNCRRVEGKVRLDTCGECESFMILDGFISFGMFIESIDAVRLRDPWPCNRTGLASAVSISVGVEDKHEIRAKKSSWLWTTADIAGMALDLG